MRNDIIFGALLPYVVFLIARHYGLSVVYALAIGSLFPIGMILISWVRQRQIAAISIITLTATLASLISSLWFDSAYLALLKGSLITGSVGLAFAASLLFPRPLVFYLADRGDAADRADIAALWERSADYRKMMRFMTRVWALVLICEALSRAILIPFIPPAAFLILSEAMWISVFALMIGWSMRYGQRRSDEILRSI